MQILVLPRLVALDSSMWCCPLYSKADLCRYDRSLWPAEDVAANHNVTPSQVKSLHISSKTPAMGKDSMKHLRQRMATVLDVELSNSA